MKTLELLAPAKNLETGIAAIEHGADAVYIGAPRHGARAAAGNSVEDIAALCRYAHQFGARVHVTVNTIVFEDELPDVLQMIDELIAAGIDALLVQDMGLLSLLKQKDLNGVVLHASTQCDSRTAEKVSWLRTKGFERVVLARELSLDEIRKIHEAVADVELEVFVHGALCVCYSGVCYASQHAFGRSANRGECAQMCRMKYSLVDADGSEVEHERYLLSLKDLCQIDRLEELAEAGACSFKIEGRLKDINYVKNVVAAYSERLNEIVRKHPDEYRRASEGTCRYSFTPNLKKTFNRGFTNYFLDGRRPYIFSPDTPKAIGERVGKVKDLRRDSLIVAGTAAFANGDGLCFINGEGELEGFRVNRAVGNALYPYRMPQGLRRGMSLYRNNDQAFEKLLSGKTAERKLPIAMRFSAIPDGFRLEISAISDGIRLKSSGNGTLCATADVAFAHQKAQREQGENIRRQLTKLGGTIFECTGLTIDEGADQWFVPNSLLADLRRVALKKFSELSEPSEFSETSEFSEFSESPEPSEPSSASAWLGEAPAHTLNIANSAARRFYEREGIRTAPAFELSPPQGALLMQCRHCLRFSLGYCVKRGGRKPTWREPLHLVLGDGRCFRLEFDCRQCQMNIFADSQSSQSSQKKERKSDE